MKQFKKVAVFALAIMLIFNSSFAFAGAKKNESTETNYIAADYGRYIRNQENDPESRAQIDAQIKVAAEEAAAEDENTNDDTSFDLGPTKDFLAYDSVNGYYFKEFEQRSVGETVEVWVALDLAFPEGDPRDAHVITDESVAEMVSIFDEIIYPIDTDFFGTPDQHFGDDALLSHFGYVPEGYYTSEDNTDKVLLLVDNVRDESFYDSSYPFFVAGFYSQTLEDYADRNIITLDSVDWETRLESTFKGTAAHEFQHLIHADNDPHETTYINEGMSDFAEYLCFGEHPWGHVNYFLEKPENSLVEWDEHYNAITGPETLADYGQAYLLQLYLYDHFGKDFVKDLAIDGESKGITSINKILDQYNAGIDFEELFERFSIAVAIDEEDAYDGIYGFKSIDIAINYETALEFDKDGVPAWGADYKKLENTDKLKRLYIDGVDFVSTPWEVVADPLDASNDVLWGGSGNEVANQMIIKADLTNVDTATLIFDNFIDIEEGWDFGLVQVSDDQGATWTSLANANTTSAIVPEGYPDIYDNLPGFSGHYADWNTESFDLTAYAGKEIAINFNYMTDWGHNDSGWFIDNIAIPEIGYTNDGTSTELSIGEFTNTRVEYAVTFINKVTDKKNDDPQYRILSMDPTSAEEGQSLKLQEFLNKGETYMIVWYAAQEGDKGYVEFSYEIDYNASNKNTPNKTEKEVKVKTNNGKANGKKKK